MTGNEPDIPGPELEINPVSKRAPTGAADCHAHVFGPHGTVPLNPGRTYTPSLATLEQFQAMHAALGIERGVIVQPSVYGTDNEYSRLAVEAMGDNGRGVAVIDATCSTQEMDKMHESGFRGARFNLESGGGVDPEQLETVAATLAERGWHLQTYISAPTLHELAPRLLDLPVDTVVDHMGGPVPELGIEQEGFQALLRGMAAGKFWVKISGAYRVDHGPAPWPAADQFAKALIEAAPERVVWGSDWPHPHLRGPMPNDGDLLNRLLSWCDGDDALLNQILVDNPARLYDFG